MTNRDSKVVRISINDDTWMAFRLEAIKIRKPAAYILGELAKRWLKHQQEIRQE